MNQKESFKGLNLLFICYALFFVFNFTLCESNNTTNSSTTATTTSTTTLSTSTTTSATPISGDCNLRLASKREKLLLEELNKIKGEKFTYEDQEHAYYFSICSKAENADNIDEGFIQINKQNKKKFVIGKLNDVNLEGSDTFMRILYKDGEGYANACQKQNRNAVVYVFCDQNNTSFKMIEENNDRNDDDCAYIFELHTPKFCGSQKAPLTTAKTPSSASSNVFPIILIVLSSLFVGYLVIGTLYMRIFHHAKGWEQIPNWSFWNAIGNYSADCCNLVCRCGQRVTEVHTYDNINDRMSDDENLLNM